MDCIAGWLLSWCQLSKSVGLKFLGCTVIHYLKCPGSTEVDFRVIQQLYEPRSWCRDRLASLALQQLESYQRNALAEGKRARILEGKAIMK